jgi:hypothetical protein
LSITLNDTVNRPKQEAKLLAKLHHPKTHANIIQIYAQGDGFVIVNALEETLRKSLLRLTKTSKLHQQQQIQIQTQTQQTHCYYYTTIGNMLSDIGLPFTRLLKHLHSQTHPVSYKVLCMDSVAFLAGANHFHDHHHHRLVLMDFSKVAVSNNPRGDDGFDDKSFDVWCLGKLLRDVLFVLKLLSSGRLPLRTIPCRNSSISAATPNPVNDRHFQKRLLEWKEPTSS